MNDTDQTVYDICLAYQMAGDNEDNQVLTALRFLNSSISVIEFTFIAIDHNWLTVPQLSRLFHQSLDN